MNDVVPAGTQTLERGLRVIDAVAAGALDLAGISRAVGLSRSTTQRLAAALLRQGFLRVESGQYLLGPKLIQLGFTAREQVKLVALARPHLERLAEEMQDSIHLVLPDGHDVLYVDKIAGQRGFELRSRIGSRMPMALTGVGKALMLDMSEAQWRKLYDEALARAQGASAAGGKPLPWEDYRAAMRRYRSAGVAQDLAENEFGVRCVAAPVRDAAQNIVAAISVAAAEPWMDATRMAAVSPVVVACAQAISSEIGGRGHA